MNESIHDESTALKASTTGKLLFGRRGQVKLSALLQKSRFASGDNIYVAVKVKNTTMRRVTGVKVELIRRAVICGPAVSGVEVENVKTITEHVMSSAFKSKEYTFKKGQERTSVLDLNIPVSSFCFHNNHTH